MSDADFKQDVERMFAEAERCQNLAQLGDALCGMVARNEAAFKDITHSYRVAATDTGTARAFALEDGRYRALDDNAKTDVTETGTEKNLLAGCQDLGPRQHDGADEAGGVFVGGGGGQCLSGGIAPPNAWMSAFLHRLDAPTLPVGRAR